MKTNRLHTAGHGIPVGRGGQVDRGQSASAPQEIPARGWWEVMKRAYSQVGVNHLQLVAAGVAFFLLLGLFPSLAAVVSIYGWIADPSTIAGHIQQLSSVLPGEASDIIRNQAQQLSSDGGKAGWGAVIGVVLAIWAGSKAMKAIVEGGNIAYREKENRGFVRKQLVYLGLTFVAVIVGILAILLIAIAPALLGLLPFPEWGKHLIVWARWPVVLLMGVTLISIIYRFGPARRRPQWKWVSWGAGGSAIVWLILSGLFSIYVSHFGSYNETYGSLGAVVILMMWLYLTSLLILIGAEVNAELEHQTDRDTTTGGERPIGERDAFVADHVAGQD